MNYAQILKVKMSNMARWVSQEIGKENLPVDIVADFDRQTAFDIAVIAANLVANRDLATRRDWSGLVQLIECIDVEPLDTIVIAVQCRPEMHDKFWRYIDSFIAVAM